MSQKGLLCRDCLLLRFWGLVWGFILFFSFTIVIVVVVIVTVIVGVGRQRQTTPIEQFGVYAAIVVGSFLFLSYMFVSLYTYVCNYDLLDYI